MQSGIVGANSNRKLDIRELRTFCLCDLFALLIFINATDTDNRKVFSLVHEAAHIWLNKDHCFNGIDIDTKIEMVCSKVASEILVPETIFLHEWETKGINNQDKIEKLSKLFKVSKVAIARKACDLKKYLKSIMLEAKMYILKILNPQRKIAEGIVIERY